ncbi:MAG: zinc ribbon domain-containing protein [Burkholderiales bacterium]|nr:zinc ribbon domain-containing protein [Burkholderiales bacterium]
MAEEEIYYEMLWDCTQCNTKGLLGDSHRHCPTCGAAQDPTERYFPKEGEEVEAKNHKFVGADWSCAYCSSPNSQAAAHCTNCGAGQDGTKPVALVADKATPEPLPSTMPTTAPKRSMGWLRWVFAALALVVIGIVFLFTSTKETTATVAQRTWAREIQIEQMGRVADSAWRDSVPGDAYGVSCSREQRSTKQVPDGQDCHTERVDKGDGTFVKRQECTTRYRDVPVYDDRCSYTVNRWRTVRSVKADTQNAMNPVWPTVSNLNANFPGGGVGSLGSEREGTRHESYVLTLGSGGKTWTCNVPENVWSKYQEGATTPLKVRLTGGADCSSLK